jgi:hypothetical protein
MESKHYNTKILFRLSESEKQQLKQLVKKGHRSARVIIRVKILQLYDKGYTSPQIAGILDVNPVTARNIGKKYMNGDLDNALYDKPRPGVDKKITEDHETFIAALACSDPPEGYERWTIRLLAQEVVSRKIVDSISKETVRVILKNHKIKPWREKNVVCPGNK